uniref:choice-of-anchor B family protein n=1 Tax=Flavobacterium sp. TaxID=239 RepID=UPI00404B0695
MTFRKTTLLFTFIIIKSFAQTPCTNGFANNFPCSNIDFYARLSNVNLGGSSNTDSNDIWGWTDPLDNQEYAIIGLESHTAFVNVSDPLNPVYLGKLQTATVSSLWRDIKVYNNHAFIVSEAANHGMQVFDLTKLRNVTSPQTFTSDAHYTEFGNCHNIAINEATGFAYAIGSNTFDGGPHIINIQNPTSPTFVSGYSAQSYCHDAQIVIYNGPDIEHQGKEIFFGANEDKVVILDVTNKNSPVLLSVFTYQNTAYTHQGWLTEDQSQFLLGDEIDETEIGFNTKTIIIDVSDLDNPVLNFNYFGLTPAIDHNGYVHGNDFYLANYRAGVRLMDITNIATGTMTEIGFFDTFPNNDSSSFNGAWSVYPYFASGTIIISDIERGLFLVKKGSALLNNEEINARTFGLYPNPANHEITIESKQPIESIEIYNSNGIEVYSIENQQTFDIKIKINQLQAGLYLVVVNKRNTQKLIINP